MKEKKVASLKIVFEDGSDYSVACEKGLDKDELANYIERAFKPEPTEPLIKDEKIRKAVRAWAEANDSTKMVFDGYHLASDEHGNDIEFSDSWAENVKHGEWYTITELCGEEEECES